MNPASTAPIPYQSLNFAYKLSLFDDHWQARVIAEMNDYQFKLVKLQGDFIWHDHPDTDETFIVLEGQLRIDFADGQVTINQGEMFVVPKGETQAVRRAGGQAAADRTQGRAQHRRRRRRTHGGQRCVDLSCPGVEPL